MIGKDPLVNLRDQDCYLISRWLTVALETAMNPESVYVEVLMIEKVDGVLKTLKEDELVRGSPEDGVLEKVDGHETEFQKDWYDVAGSKGKSFIVSKKESYERGGNRVARESDAETFSGINEDGVFNNKVPFTALKWLVLSLLVISGPGLSSTDMLCCLRSRLREMFKTGLFGTGGKCAALVWDLK